MIFYSSVFNETLKKIVKNYQANKEKIQKRSRDQYRNVSTDKKIIFFKKTLPTAEIKKSQTQIEKEEKNV